MRPRLKRENCLEGAALASALQLATTISPPLLFATGSSLYSGSLVTDSGGSGQDLSAMDATAVMEPSPFWVRNAIQHTQQRRDVVSADLARVDVAGMDGTLRLPSLFERVLAAHPPIVESLLAQLPTASILNLYRTSSTLRSFLQEYPLAWRALSFRLPQPSLFNSPGADTPDSRERLSKQYALDALLIQVVMPVATRLKSLDLDNTAISGVALVSKVLQPRISTLEHLSVRGCKNVSIKYHIVPFLQLHNHTQHPWADKLALKSLYTYRCRHHRRRPYLPSSLIRRDSDSEPTHELIEACHQLGIWTDTAWCPTPGARCARRKEYHNSRAAPGTQEVWVPFDRLWRSGNRLGPSEEKKSRAADGRLWEENEIGHDGEALGTDTTSNEGKYMPAHLRSSHTTFVDDVSCDQCGDAILERCETCSIKMHCMGCRKTLCASCAYNRPIPRKRAKVAHFSSLLGSTHSALTYSSSDSAIPSPPSPRRQNSKREKNKFWWAPGTTRSPNLMSELPADSDSEDDDGLNPASALPPAPLKLSMHWCCIEPTFSGGGGVMLATPSGQWSGPGADRLRAVPLPKQKQYEDPDFQHTLIDPQRIEKLKNVRLYEEIMGEDVDILPYLTQEDTEAQNETCPRSLCQDCYRSFRWKVACRGCKRPLCKEHDFRGLKVKKCGYRDLATEREHIRNPPPISHPTSSRSGKWNVGDIPAFRRTRGAAATHDSSRASTPVPFGDDEDGPVSMARIASTASSSADSSQLFAPASTPTATDNVPMQDGEMGHSFADLLTPRSTAGPSTTRPRSVSLSGLSSSASSSNGYPSGQPTSRAEIQKRLLLPGNGNHPVQWQGCGAYFCQSTRATNDHRPPCSMNLDSRMKHVCADCGVFVCEYCLLDTPACACTYCSSTFHCPSCAIKPGVRALCTRDEEIRAMEMARERERERLKKEEEQRVWADEVAEAVGEFYLGVDD